MKLQCFASKEYYGLCILAHFRIQPIHGHREMMQIDKFSVKVIKKCLAYGTSFQALDIKSIIKAP